MEWKQSVIGVPLCVQLLWDNDTRALNLKENAEAGTNILGLAQLAAWKAFVWLELPEDTWLALGEDAVQASIVALLQEKTMAQAPRLAYFRMRRFCTGWARRYALGQSRPNGVGQPYLQVPPMLSLDGLDWEPCLQTVEADQWRLNPEQMLTKDEGSDRQWFVQHFFDIVHHLVLEYI